MVVNEKISVDNMCYIRVFKNIKTILVIITFGFW